MKYGLLTITVFVLGIATACNLVSNKKTDAVNMKNETANTAGSFEPVAVIELFTSQGCSSCPPADRLLGKTIAAAGSKKIYALSFHVDYWNRLGWPDPFSSAAFSQRQAEYVSALNASGSYTPQMVINGRNEFVGSDANALNRSLSKMLSEKSTVSFTKLNLLREGNRLKVSYTLEGEYAGQIIHFALVSLQETTSVKRGENGGVTLKNDNVVRQFLSAGANAYGEAEFAASPVPQEGNLSVIAYVQQKNAGSVSGAAATQ